MNIEFVVRDWDTLKKNALKQAHKKAGEVAVVTVLSPRVVRRFDGSMEDELGWKARDPKYQKRKLRVKKRSAYANYSGRTRGIMVRQAYSSVRVSGTATKWKAGIRFRELPLYVKRPRRGAKVILRRELKKSSVGEMREMKRVFRDEFVRFLNDDPRARVKRRRRI